MMNDQTPDDMDIQKDLRESMGDTLETNEDPVLRKMRSEDGLGEIPQEYEEHFIEGGDTDDAGDE